MSTCINCSTHVSDLAPTLQSIHQAKQRRDHRRVDLILFRGSDGGEAIDLIKKYYGGLMKISLLKTVRLGNKYRANV